MVRAYFKYFFLTIFLSGVFFCAPDQIRASTDSLDKIPEYLPFRIESASQHFTRQTYRGVYGLPLALTNVDEDPELEIIRCKSSYLVCEEYSSSINLNHWQLNFPAEFHCTEGYLAGFCVRADLDLGRDFPMIVVNGHTADYQTHRFWIVDPRVGTIESFFDLPGGEDLNGDKSWDGGYHVLGAMDIPTATGPIKGIIIICNVGFDLYRRGVYAVDPWTGNLLWDFQMGASPMYSQCKIIDIDGDGQNEVLIATNAPNNLNGQKINGFSDDRSYLITLKANGDVAWSRELGDIPGTSYLQAGDLDGDGNIEVVTTMRSIHQNKGKVSVWSANGELIHGLESEGHFFESFLIPGRLKNHLDIITTNHTSSIYKIEFDNRKLTIQDEVTNRNGFHINGLMDLPENQDGPGLITQDHTGRGRILDRNLNIIASYQDKKGRFARQVVSGFKGDQASFVLVNSDTGCNSLVPTPMTLATTINRYLGKSRALVFAGLGMGLLIASLLWFLAHRRSLKSPKSEIPEPTGLIHLKERRLHLLEDLELSNHGAMAPLRSLRRLLWMLDAVQSGVSVNPDLVARMKEIWQDCQEDALPRLTNILERARLAKISDSVVEESLSTISRINTALIQLNNENYTAESIDQHLANLHKEEKTTEALLQNLRRQVSEYFQAPLDHVLEKVLRANAHTIEENNVNVQMGMVAAMEAGGTDAPLPPESPSCRMDADELSFILDNLVGNACRAMASAPNRNLRITWQPVDGLVKIEIADTGIGIATEDHQRVLETGYTHRPGGGLGLPKSQRLLKKYGGHLSIKRSSPGQGTTFLLVVPRA